MRWLTVLLCLATFSYAQDAAKVPDERIAKAIEGAALLHSEMRDPDSFKLGSVLLAHSDKHNFYAVCFDYYSRNGYGGMNHEYADYSPHSGKDFKAGALCWNTSKIPQCLTDVAIAQRFSISAPM